MDKIWTFFDKPTTMFTTILVATITAAIILFFWWLSLQDLSDLIQWKKTIDGKTYWVTFGHRIVGEVDHED